jgi:hypothetical protein
VWQNSCLALTLQVREKIVAAGSKNMSALAALLISVAS